MLSLGVDSIKVGQLSLALLLQGLILRFRFFVISLGVNFHHLDLLLGIDQHLLGVGLSFVDVSDSLGLNLVDNNLLLTFGLSDQDRSVLLSLDFENILIRIGLQNLLL